MQSKHLYEQEVGIPQWYYPNCFYQQAYWYQQLQNQQQLDYWTHWPRFVEDHVNMMAEPHAARIKVETGQTIKLEEREEEFNSLTTLVPLQKADYDPQGGLPSEADPSSNMRKLEGRMARNESLESEDFQSSPVSLHDLKNEAENSSPDPTDKNFPEKNSKLHYQRFKSIVNSSESDRTFEEIVMLSKKELLSTINQEIIEAQGQLRKRYFNEKLTLARKNMTHNFLKLLRLAIKVMQDEEGRSAYLNRFRRKLGITKVNIRAITSLFQQAQSNTVIEFFKNRIFLLKKMPEYVMALGVKPAEKYVMMPMLEGFVYSLHHAEENFSSWDLEAHSISGSTSSLARSIEASTISYEQAMQQVNKIYSDLLVLRPEIANCSKYNNISYYFRNKLVRGFKELIKQTRSKDRKKELTHLFDSTDKLFSIKGIIQLLEIEPLRTFLKTHYIDNNRMIKEILDEGGLSCHNKKIIMESFPKFAAAIENPRSLTGWHS